MVRTLKQTQLIYIPQYANYILNQNECVLQCHWLSVVGLVYLEGKLFTKLSADLGWILFFRCIEIIRVVKWQFINKVNWMNSVFFVSYWKFLTDFLPVPTSQLDILCLFMNIYNFNYSISSKFSSQLWQQTNATMLTIPQTLS